MCKLQLSDFCYGAFLSAFVKAPVLFDETGSRRIYCLETNSEKDCWFMVKYVKELKNKNDQFSHWLFNFTDAEVEKLQELRAEKERVKLALICLKEGWSGSELAIVDYEDAADCLGISRGIKNYRINIKAFNKKHGLRIYGSGRNDKVDSKDNTLKISRQELSMLR